MVSDRFGRRIKRVATTPLIATHTPRHTHTSELKVIPRRARRKPSLFLIDRDSDERFVPFSRNSGTALRTSLDQASPWRKIGL
jgi:hypothetical protein